MRCRAFVSGSVIFVGLHWCASAFAGPVPVSNVAELRTAIAGAKPGDEIILAAGTYAISGNNVSCSASGTAAQPIVVRSATPLAAKLELSVDEGFVVNGAHWHFEGLDVKGICADDSDCEHAFHVVGGGSNFVLRNNRIVDFNAQLKVNASPPTIPNDGLIENNELFDTHARDTGNPITKLNIDTGERWIVRANYIHDFHRAGSDSATYGAFMKSGGKNGLFERNLVLCTKDENTDGVYIGLSFGGGGTGAQFCAPAFNAGVPCDVEHDGGTMRNNIIANCSDVGIYLNKGKDTKLLHNTLIATSGIDFRYATSTGEARGNVVTGVIRNRDGSSHTAADNLQQVALATFEAMYTAPLVGDLRKKGELAALLGKAPMNANVPDDYCLRPRTGMWDLGALQHSLGDCTTVTPPQGTSSSSGDGGSSGASSGGASSGGADGGGSSGASGGTSSGNGADPSGDADDGGCGCRTTARSEAPALALAGSVLALAAARLRRRRR
jgi:parallel beta-helix repeat protein